MPRSLASLAWIALAALAGGSLPEERPLALDPVVLRGEVEGITVLSASQTPPLAVRILDVAWITEDRLVVLSDEAVSVYRREAQSLKREAHRPHPSPLAAVRAPAGSIGAVETERAFWVATNRLSQVRLFTWEGTRLVETQQADALPGGLRYRAGTNLLEMGDVVLLRMRQGLAVSPEGRLGVLDDGPPVWTALRVGDALARPWPRVAAASSPRPPGREDALTFYELGPEPRPLGVLPLEGSVRALACRRQREDASLVLAVQAEDGERLLFLRLGREER